MIRCCSKGVMESEVLVLLVELTLSTYLNLAKNWYSWVNKNEGILEDYKYACCLPIVEEDDDVSITDDTVHVMMIIH